jgi:hypothetical protein
MVILVYASMLIVFTLPAQCKSRLVSHLIAACPRLVWLGKAWHSRAERRRHTGRWILVSSLLLSPFVASRLVCICTLPLSNTIDPLPLRACFL